MSEADNELRYWIGSEYSDPSTALGFVMNTALENPGISHSDLLDEVQSKFTRKSGSETTKSFASSLVKYAVKNNRLVTSEEEAGQEYPTKKERSEKSEGAVRPLSDLNLSVLSCLKKGTPLESLPDEIGKSSSVVKRAVSTLKKKGYLEGDGEEVHLTSQADEILEAA